MNKRVLLKLTGEQSDQLETLFATLETDGAVMCQAWRDGIVATTLTAEDAEKVIKALNRTIHFTSSALE